VVALRAPLKRQHALGAKRTSISVRRGSYLYEDPICVNTV
jgi:hypothetical protein